MVVQVAVEATAFYFDKLYSYRVPPKAFSQVKRGCRVLVPFGRGNSLREGMVFAVEEGDGDGELKELEGLLDDEPVLDEEGFRIVEYMAETTFCSLYDGVKCLLPAGLSVNASRHYFAAKKPDEQDILLLPEDERLLLQKILSSSSQKETDRLFFGREGAAYRKTAESLCQKGFLQLSTSFSRKVGDKTVKMVRLTGLVDSESSSLTAKQREVVSVLEAVGVAAEKELAYHAGVTEGVIRTLEKKGAVEFFKREVYRTPVKPVESFSSLNELCLSAEQQQVFSELLALSNISLPKAALLFGVTGSGKTQIFIKLIEETVRAGRQALLMVPEIALTPQLLNKFTSLFGSSVAILHSGLSLGERLDEYKRIKNQLAPIVIGTRSSVFAPLNNIGLIIMDEEGEHSYKSDTTPRYHARDIAKLRCVYHKALLLFASATPSVESYYYGKTGRYALFTLTKRYGAANLPEVSIVDMKAEEQKYNFGLFSDRLAEALLSVYEKGEQSILLLNRRGYSTYGVCIDCGEGVKCPNCSVSLTYHKVNGYLMCHYCGYTRRLAAPCGHCGGKHIRLMGAGTQKIEEAIKEQIPSARILRMDTDTTYSRYAYEEKFSQFAAGDYDIMVGTQMVAKGLNFPKVTLVGVLSGDQYLYSGDFRCGEKTFSLITQVVGRSGRYEQKGQAIIQTHAPENAVILSAARQDYLSFFNEEIAMRKAALQPPFCDLAVIGFSGKDDGEVRQKAERFYRILFQLLSAHKELPSVLLGVTQPSVSRINGKYRYRIIIKCKNNRKFRDLLRKAAEEGGKQRLYSGCSVYFDMNGEVT